MCGPQQCASHGVRQPYTAADLGEFIGFSSRCPAVFYRLRNQICSNPRRRAMVTACVRSLAPSLSTRFLIWKLTVVSAIVN
jgi:hypothetical protein